MGLDMYLNKRIYVGNEFRKEEEQVKVILPENDTAMFPIKDFDQKYIKSITVSAIYWRKANAIH